MKVVIAGGGTGGHVYMGIAVARELMRREDGTQIVFIGTARGLESRIVPQEGLRLETIDSTGIQRVGVSALIRGLIRVPRSLWQSRRLLARHDPDVIVGLGGYASGPVVLAGWWRRIPTLIIEPNALPGLTNRWLARIASRIALGLRGPSWAPPDRAEVTGIPVRDEFRQVTSSPEAGRLTVLVYGGSQGSRLLNTQVGLTLSRLRDHRRSLRWIHQTGASDLERVRRCYRENGFEADVRPYLPRIHEELARADLILCRAGAGTLAELTVAGKAALLVPFRAAAGDHQVENARSLQQAGAARMIEEPELTPERLQRELEHYLAHPEELGAMGKAARALGRPDAARRIGDLVEELAAARSRN